MDTDLDLLEIITKDIKTAQIENRQKILPLSDILRKYSSSEQSDGIEIERIREGIRQLEENNLIKKDSEDTISFNIPSGYCANQLFPEIDAYIRKNNSDPDKKTVLKLLTQTLDTNGSMVLTLLERLGYFSFQEDVLTYSPVHVRDHILDEVLTFIETLDAQQIKYGVYDTSVTGYDVLSGLDLPSDPLRLKVEYGLRELRKEGFLLPFDIGEDVIDWRFRSRIAEITRLTEKLRQRFEYQSEPETKKLTRSVKLEIRDRKYPRRETPIENAVHDLREILEFSENLCIERPDESTLDQITRDLIDALCENGFTHISDYQYRSFKSAFTQLISKNNHQEGLILTAGTGMGKTLSYIVPLLYYCLLANPDKRGTKSINVYPRIKLAENQIEGFIKVIHTINKLIPERSITLGIDYSGTPYQREDFRNDPNSRTKTLYTYSTNRLWKANDSEDAYACPYAKCPVCGGPLLIYRNDPALEGLVPPPLICETCQESVDYVRYTKDDLTAIPPDILVITTEMISKGLSQSKYQPIFGTEEYCSPKLVMIDEVHLHTAIKGSQVAMVVRRLLNRISLAQDIRHYKEGSPMAIGLSATIGKPTEFFSDFTGIPERNIRNEHPREEEYIKSGAEYFLFVKPETENTAVLSNLIQTCMCVIHNMPKKVGDEGESPKGYKALGFVDSLDLVKRWQRDLDDAEQEKQLFSLRDPERINKNPSIAGFFPGIYANAECEKCRECVNENCIHFREGECWWFMRYGEKGVLPTPLDVKYKTAGEGDVPESYDLLVTTSAMEVGFDDPDIMCIVQYQSPMNIASFTQRKGRAGRGLRNRPITVTVLSPYRTKDVFYYRNHHNLLDPSFNKPPLNMDNQAIHTIHGFYAILDLIAWENRSKMDTFPSSGVNGEGLKILNAYDVENGLDYLRSLIGHDIDSKVLSNIKDLFNKYRNRLVTEVNKPFGSDDPARLLPDDLPENLFSSVNLPAVNIYDFNPQAKLSGKYSDWNKSWRCGFYPPDPKQFAELVQKGECPKSFQCGLNRKCEPNRLEPNLEINHALQVASVSNVNLRWRSSSYWIPPYLEKIDAEGKTLPVPQYDIGSSYIFYQDHQEDYRRHHIPVKHGNIPRSLLPYLPFTQEHDDLLIHRPDAIRVTKFQRYGTPNSHWIYCEGCNNFYAGINSRKYQMDHPDGTDHKYQVLNQKTKSYQMGFFDVEFDREGLRASEKLSHINPENCHSDFEKGKYLGIFAPLLSSIYFANGNTGEYLTVKKGIVAAQCNIAAKKETLEYRVGYCQKKEDAFNKVNFHDAGIGYSMETDGLNISIKNTIAESLEGILKEEQMLYRDLLTNIFKFEIFYEQKKPDGENTFTIEAFLNIYLSLIKNSAKGSAGSENGSYWNSEKVSAYISNGVIDPEFIKEIKTGIERFGKFNTRTKENVLRIAEDPDFIGLVITKHAQVLDEKDPALIQERISDIFVHSLKHTLKSSCLILGGFDSERDIGGWTYLNYDFDRQKQIYVFEHGMYGTGAFLSIYHLFKEQPHRFWNFIETNLGTCPTADEETFLNGILRMGNNGPEEESILPHIAEKIRVIATAKGFKERESAIRNLRQDLREQWGVECSDDQLRALMRVFCDPFELDGTEIENWRLYDELNKRMVDLLRGWFGRTPTLQEVEMYTFNAARGEEEECALTEWNKLLKILNENNEDKYQNFERKIQKEFQNHPFVVKVIGDLSLEELQRISEAPIDIQKQCIIDKAKKIELDSGFADEKEFEKEACYLIRNVFETTKDVEHYPFYYYISRKEQVPKKAQREITEEFVRDSFYEEVEKRLLNTCTDGCPSCLQTACDLDWDPKSSKLLLSRRLLKVVLENMKEEFRIDASDLSSDEIERSLIESLMESYQVYLIYPEEKAATIARIISRLVPWRVVIDEKRYRCFVNSSRIWNTPEGYSTNYHELSLRLKEVEI